MSQKLESKASLSSTINVIDPKIIVAIENKLNHLNDIYNKDYHARKCETPLSKLQKGFALGAIQTDF